MTTLDRLQRTLTGLYVRSVTSDQRTGLDHALKLLDGLRPALVPIDLSEPVKPVSRMLGGHQYGYIESTGSDETERMRSRLRRAGSAIDYLLI